MARKAKSSSSATSAPSEIDPRAVKILIDTYLKRINSRDEPLDDTPEIAYARSQGLIVDPVVCTHDEKVNRVADACARVTAPAVARGFLASLASNRLEFRGALGCYAIFRHMPRHRYQPKDPADAEHRRQWCVVCEDMNYPFPNDLNWVSFHRFRQGCAYDSPLEAAFLLERFMECRCPDPTADDRRVLQAILDAAASLPADALAGQLEKAVAKLLKTNKYARQSLLESLGYCGILQSKDCPSYLDGFVPFEQRVYPSGRMTEWSYPIRCWRGSDGVNSAAVRFWFPEIG